MTAILEKLTLYWAYPFVRYALVVGVLIALCSSLLGVTLVLKRFSFIGDGLSHVAFGAMAIAAVLQITNEIPLVMVITIISAVLLLRTGQNTKIKGDAVIAMISVGALAIGYLLMNIFSTSSNLSSDVCSTLFGSTSILTLSSAEVWLCVGMSVLVVAVFILFYNKIFAVTFDENFARATGTKAGLYNLLIAIVVAVIIALAMNLVGSLLISALVIFPALSSMRLFKSFRSVTICAAALSVFCALIGILVSILAGTPVGSTIVAVQIVLFALCSLVVWSGRKWPMKRPAILCLAGILLLAFSACGNNGGSVQSESLTPPAVSQPAEATPERTPSAEEPLPAESGDGQGDGSVLPAVGSTLEEETEKPPSGLQPDSKEVPTVPVDVDLTTLSSTMVYAEVFNMMLSPDDYIGKTIRITGIFSVYQDPKTKQVYCGVIVQDATACCAQGFDLVLSEELSYPQDYPDPESEITVVGTLQADRTLKENGIVFLRLENVTFESSAIS